MEALLNRLDEMEVEWAKERDISRAQAEAILETWYLFKGLLLQADAQIEINFKKKGGKKRCIH